MVVLQQWWRLQSKMLSALRTGDSLALETLLDLGIKFDDARMVKEAQSFLRYVTCMTEFDLVKTDDLLDVAFPLLSRMAESKSTPADFDPDIDEEDRGRLKQWQTHTPSSAPKVIPL